jgi:hypothetical protein
MNILVMDIESSTDGHHCGEDQVRLLSPSNSTHPSNLLNAYQGANTALLKTVVEVNFRLFGERYATFLPFSIC